MIVASLGAADNAAAEEFRGLTIANAPPAGVVLDVPQTVTEATPKYITIPKGVEFSTFTGIALPGATGGGMVSLLVAKTEGEWAQVFGDLGLALVEAKPLAVVAGLSYALNNDELPSRAGVGLYYLFTKPGDGSTRWGIMFYVRFPSGGATKTVEATDTDF